MSSLLCPSRFWQTASLGDASCREGWRWWWGARAAQRAPVPLLTSSLPGLVRTLHPLGRMSGPHRDTLRCPDGHPLHGAWHSVVCSQCGGLGVLLGLCPCTLPREECSRMIKLQGASGTGQSKPLLLQIAKKRCQWGRQLALKSLGAPARVGRDPASGLGLGYLCDLAALRVRASALESDRRGLTPASPGGLLVPQCP